MLEQVHARDEELKKVQDQLLELKERNRVAIEEMFAANESEKAKQKDALDRVESLCASVNQKDKRLTEYSKEVQGLRQQIDSIKSSYSLELDKVSQSAKDISTLQQNLKEKDKTIDKMKTAGSSLKSMVSTAQKKIEELEAEKASLSQALQTSQGRLHNLESFTVPELELDEKSM
jgi:chromosome segregation ATPase